MVENRNTGQTAKQTGRQTDSDMTGRKIDTQAGR